MSPGFTKSPRGEAQHLPHDIWREDEKQYRGFAVTNCTVNSAVEIPKTVARKFSEYRISDYVNGNRQDREAKEQQTKE